jgi:hypothetical protein
VPAGEGGTTIGNLLPLNEGVAIVCPNMGIVEPVVNAIIKFLLAPQFRQTAPGLIDRMARIAVGESSNPSLGMRCAFR